MKARVTVLGSGTSHGVPMIGCTCAVCRSTDPRDRRTRPSIYVAVDERPEDPVDTSTDLRSRRSTQGVTRVDAILFTHSHADHIMGLDEVAPLQPDAEGAPIPAYADEPHRRRSLRRTFSYVFDPPTEKGGGMPQIELHDDRRAVRVDGVGIQPVPICARLAADPRLSLRRSSRT